MPRVEELHIEMEDWGNSIVYLEQTAEIGCLALESFISYWFRMHIYLSIDGRNRDWANSWLLSTGSGGGTRVVLPSQKAMVHDIQ